MRVATRLRITFGVLLAALGTVSAVHVITMRQTVQGTRALSAIAAREQGESLQRRRLDDMSASLGKYRITRDREYLERLATLARAHEEQIRALEVQAIEHHRRKVRFFSTIE